MSNNSRFLEMSGIQMHIPDLRIARIETRASEYLQCRARSSPGAHFSSPRQLNRLFDRIH